MGLRFTLQNEDRVLLDLPLSETEWKPRVKELVMKGLGESEADIESLCAICDFFSIKRRVQMLSHMVKDCNNSATFTDLLKVAVNPKYISDLVSTSSSRELIVRGSKGYSVSPIGLESFLLLSLATRRLLNETNSINDDDKSFEGQ